MQRTWMRSEQYLHFLVSFFARDGVAAAASAAFLEICSQIVRIVPEISEAEEFIQC